MYTIFWEINKKRALLKNLYAIIGFDAPIRLTKQIVYSNYSFPMVYRCSFIICSRYSDKGSKPISFRYSSTFVESIKLCTSALPFTNVHCVPYFCTPVFRSIIRSISRAKFHDPISPRSTASSTWSKYFSCISSGAC